MFMVNEVFIPHLVHRERSGNGYHLILETFPKVFIWAKQTIIGKEKDFSIPPSLNSSLNVARKRKPRNCGSNKVGMWLDHIDPIDSDHICGFEILSNEIIRPKDYNLEKNNRFVPYFIGDYPAPKEFGDVGEFLINGERTVVTFGGPEWMAESKRIGFSSVKGGKTRAATTPTSFYQEIGRKGAEAQIEREIGIFGAPKETKNEWSARGGANGRGNPGRRRSNGSKTNKQLWMSTVTGKISTSAGISSHHKKFGYDPSARINLHHFQEKLPMDLKQALATLIDAYADAKSSKNQILVAYATQELQNFIQQVDIVPAPPAPAESEES